MALTLWCVALTLSLFLCVRAGAAAHTPPQTVEPGKLLTYRNGIAVMEAGLGPMSPIVGKGYLFIARYLQNDSSKCAPRPMSLGCWHAVCGSAIAEFGP